MMVRVALAHAAAVFALFLAACGGGAQRAATSETPTASPSVATGTATTQPTSTPRPADTWVVGEPKAVPSDLAIWVERGCWGCDGPAERLDRVTSGANGPATRNLLPKLTGNAYYSSFRSAPGGLEGYAMVCTRGYCGGVGQVSADAQNTLRRTRDGGITWEDVTTFDGMASVAGISALGPVIARTTFSGGGFTTIYRILNGPEVLPPSPGAILFQQQPSTMLIWLGADRATVLRSDSVVVFRLDKPAGIGDDFSFNVVAGTPDLKRLLVAWRVGNASRYAIVRDGVIEREISAPSSFSLFGGVWLTETTVVASLAEAPGLPGTAVPALVDLVTLDVTPLTAGFAPEDVRPGRRNLVRAAAKGPFVTVKTGGDCLNVRELPATAAKSFGCFKDGTIFALRNAAEIATGWTAVTGPGGTAGWVNDTFVQR